MDNQLTQQYQSSSFVALITNHLPHILIVVLFKSINQSINQLCLMRVTYNSLQLINPWPSNSRSNWNLEMLVFEEGGKPENPEKNPRSKGENQQQIQPTYDAGSGNQTRDTLVGGERSHHCANLAPHRTCLAGSDSRDEDD